MLAPTKHIKIFTNRHGVTFQNACTYLLKSRPAANVTGKVFFYQQIHVFFCFRERTDKGERRRRSKTVWHWNRIPLHIKDSQMPLCGTCCHRLRYVATYRVCLALCAVCLRTVIGISKETATYLCESWYWALIVLGYCGVVLRVVSCCWVCGQGCYGNILTHTWLKIAKQGYI